MSGTTEKNGNAIKSHFPLREQGSRLKRQSPIYASTYSSHTPQRIPNLSATFLLLVERSLLDILVSLKEKQSAHSRNDGQEFQ